MIIDCDTHIIPRDAFDTIDEKLKQLRPLLYFDKEGLYTHSDFPAKPAPVPGTTPLPSYSKSRGGSGTDLLGMTDIEVRLKDLQRLGVDQQVILPQFTPWAWSNLLEPHLAAAIARCYNQSIVTIMRQHPKKFIGVAHAPLQDVEAGIREVEWARNNGFKAVVVDYTFAVKEHP